MIKIALFLVSLISSAAPLPPVAQLELTCPLDESTVRVPAILIGPQTGVGLDLRPLGVPQPPVGRCAKCGLPLPFPLSFDKREEVKIRGVLASAEYRAALARWSNRALRALVISSVSGDLWKVARAWLEASWDGDCKDCLARAVQAFGEIKREASDEAHEGDRVRTSNFLKVELSRQLGKFDEATAQLAALEARPEFQRGVYPGLVRAESSLISARDAAPHAVPPLSHKLDPRDDDPAWLLARSLPGFARASAVLEIESATRGNINGAPDSLFLNLRARSPGLFDAVWWWDVMEGERPKYTWDELLVAFEKAQRTLSKVVWLTEWRKAGKNRVIEFHLVGIDKVSEDMVDFFLIPPWREAGFAGAPAFEVLLRRGSEWCGSLFFSADGASGIVTHMTPEEGGHWLDALRISYHPNAEDPSYLRVDASARHEMRSTKRAGQTPKAMDAGGKR